MPLQRAKRSAVSTVPPQCHDENVRSLSRSKKGYRELAWTRIHDFQTTFHGLRVGEVQKVG